MSKGRLPLLKGGLPLRKRRRWLLKGSLLLRKQGLQKSYPDVPGAGRGGGAVAKVIN